MHLALHSASTWQPAGVAVLLAGLAALLALLAAAPFRRSPRALG